ncbi:transcriptional regulator family: Fungal Specific TF and C2H2 zinc finger [Paecilomyces variotii]|nr:transcriptional regulator family: Fungal Specific TF and C2H2 zinc finger [Paecilomyces variotii]
MTATGSMADGARKSVCKVCQKAFSKAEHLRRHERSHTGSKPFVCKDCRRPFARQDALIRHERLHTRRSSNKNTTPLSPSTSEPTRADSVSPWQDGSVHGHDRTAVAAIQTPATQDQTWIGSQSEDVSGLHHGAVGTELDFGLIWPDAEELFQTIMSSDTTDQWQIPLGALPFPPTVPPPSGFNLDSPSSFDDRGSSVGAIPSGEGHQAVHDVTEMVTSSSSSVTAAVKATSITSVFLDECLHMFFVRFIPTFPILHRATFVFRECTHPLLLNAIAIGSLYLGPKTAAGKGEALWRLAHTAVATSWQSLITHRGPYDVCKGVQLVITALLGQVYGALSKNQAIRTTSQVFRALGFFWARHCGMFDSEPWNVENLPSLNASNAEKEHHWRTWAAREIQQRAILAYYILDGIVAQMSGDSTSVRHVANPLTLSCDDAIFNASTADEWIVLMRSRKTEQPSFRLIFRSLFSPSSSSYPLDLTFSVLSLRVILEGFQSLILDCDENNVATVGVPARSDVRKALAQLHEGIGINTHLSSSEKLEIFLRWHTICLDTVTNSSLLCSQVCSIYGITQHLCGGNKAPKARLDLAKWANSRDARRALLHAVAIQDIVEQLPRGRAHVIHMPSSLFAAAIIYTLFSLAGLASVCLPRMPVWREVLLSQGEDDVVVGDMIPGSETSRYIRGELRGPTTGGTTRNLLYELNSMQKLFRCLASQWGIAHDMEDVVDKWISLCH